MLYKLTLLFLTSEVHIGLILFFEYYTDLYQIVNKGGKDRCIIELLFAWL